MMADTRPPVSNALRDRLCRGSDADVRAALRAVPLTVAAAWAIELADDVPRQARTSLTQGKRVAFAAMTLARRAGDPTVLARALRADGHRFALNAEYRRAIGQYTRAAALFSAQRDSLQLAVTYSGSLQALIYLGLYDRAHRDAAKARAIFRRAKDRARLARLESNVGNIHFRQDRFAAALTCYRKAEAELRELGEHENVAVALRNIAVCLTSLNRFDESLETYGEARRYCVTYGLRLLVAEADYNVAYLHFLCGEYERALSAYAAARTESEALGDRYHRTLCDLDEAEVCLELNDDERACERAKEAADGFATLGLRYERAKALVFLGTARSRTGDTAAALAAYRRARTLFAADGNAAWVAIADLARATALFQAGRASDASRALPRRTTALPPTARILVDLLEARLALRAGQPRRAARSTALAARRLNQVHAPALEWQVHLVCGETAEAIGDASAARTSYRRARRSLDQLRAHVATDELKVAFLANKLDVYENLVRLSMTQDAPSPTRDRAVLQLIEDAKSRSLADQLAFRAGTLPGSAGAAGSVATVRTLRQEVRAYERRIAHEALRDHPDEPRLRKWRHAMAGRERQLTASLTDLRTRDVGLADLQTGVSAGVDRIQTALPAETTLLEYYVAHHTVYAAVLTADRLDVVPLGSITEVERRLRLLRFQLAKFQLGPDYVRTFATVLSTATHHHLQDLYEMVIAPVASRLRGRQLVVVPHGQLHYLPVHALFDGERYLMDRFSIAYAPSATVYRLCQARPPSPHTASLVMAVADQYAPHIKREADEVGRALPAAHVLRGDDATADRLRDLGSRARFVHIATHGFFRRDNPMLSAVRLADGYLSLADLYTLSLDADLVTLSGCGTGLSAVVGGDELVGMMRGLLFAGARSVLLTMWQVDDLSTAEFMSSFYALLVKGSSKTEAVSAAMREVRQRFPHPYYWAPFVLVGQTDPPYIFPPAGGPMDVKGCAGGS